MDLQIGINPISWSNDDLQHVGGYIPLETCLSDASSVGYDGVELGHKFPRDAASLKPLLEEYGLSLVSGWYSGELLTRSAREETAAMEQHAGLLQAMGCKVLIFAEVTACIHSARDVRMSRRPKIPPGDWQSFGRRMTEVAKAAAGKGLKLCYHHHMGTVVQSMEDVDQLMNATGDDVYLLLDTGHAMFAGADPAQLAKIYATRIGHLHCKDIREPVMRRCLNRDCSFLDAVLDGVFTVPGDGCVDYSSIFATLETAGYPGWAVVEAEQDPAVADPLKFASLGYENLRRFIQS